MSSRAAKADKALQDKLQALLSHLLREEDNKYCADCDAKGPRWASWNLGVFVCIRCAGIHRNLGVHISRVKSVNLDTWTEEQVGSMQNMGNSKGRAVYEANRPDGFRRPQNDSALEAFIRNKYEHKKYIAREWIPPTTPFKADFSVLGLPTGGSSGRGQSEKKLDLSNIATSVPRPNAVNSSSGASTTPVSPAATADRKNDAASPSGDDLFADFISAPLPTNVVSPKTADRNSLSPDSEEKDFFNQVSSGPAVSSSSGANTNNGLPVTNGTSNGKIDKASILSLYAKAPPVQSPLLLQQQQQQQQQQQAAAGLNVNLMGPLSGITPQMIANNPFLVGGVIAPQPPQPLGVQPASGYVQQRQQAAVSNTNLSMGGGYRAVLPTGSFQQYAANQNSVLGGSITPMAPLSAGSAGSTGGNATLPVAGLTFASASAPISMTTGAQGFLGAASTGNFNLINAQLAGLQLGSTVTGSQQIPSMVNQSRAPTANGTALAPNFTN